MIIGYKNVPVNIYDKGSFAVIVGVTYVRDSAMPISEILDYWINPVIAKQLPQSCHTDIFLRAKRQLIHALCHRSSDNHDRHNWKEECHG